MIFHQENIDSDKHCKHYFGEYVLLYIEYNISNSNTPRALDCIYSIPTTSA